MRWSYKTVHYELKKEGLLGSAFLDESEIEFSLNEYGRAGWELVSTLETMDGVIAVFKQPLSSDSSSLFHLSPAENDYNQNGRVERKEHPEGTEEEAASAPHKIMAGVETERQKEDVPPVFDEFEITESGVNEADPAEKKSPEQGKDIGSIRIL